MSPETKVVDFLA